MTSTFSARNFFMNLSASPRRAFWLALALVSLLALVTVPLTRSRAAGPAPHPRVVEAPQTGSIHQTPTLLSRANRTRASFAPHPFTLGTCDTAGPIEIEASGGTPGPTAYATLKAAFDAINAGTHTLGISVEVCGDTTEAASAVLNASGSGAASYSFILIKPAGGVSRTISGSIAGPLVDLNGADNVTIDGLNTGGNALTIDNTLSASTPSAIRFIADATSNTVQNCTIKSAETSTTLGTVFFSTGTTTGNDSNIINSNTITSSGANFATNGIYSSGTSSAVDNGAIQITSNNIQDYFNAASVTAGINLSSTGNSGWTITGNKLFQSATRIYTTANTHNGIFVGTGQGYTISNNTIGFANSAGTGTTNIVGNSVALTGTFPSSYTTTGTANTTRYIAINATFTAAGTVSSIQNNTIAGFALYTSSGATTTNGVWCGIQVLAGNANIGTTTGNTIGTATASVYAAATTSGAMVAGIYATTVNTVSIQNNSIQNIDSMGTTSSISGSINGINAAGTPGNFDISGNTIGNATNPNLRMGNLNTGANLSNTGTTFGAASGTGVFQGILNSATGTVTIGTVALPNTIRNANVNSTGSSSRVAGIQTSGGTNTIDSNSIFNLTTQAANTSSSSSPAAVGIHLSISGLTHSITRNTIRDLSSTAASAAVYVDGIYIGSTPATTMSKNNIYNLTTASTSTTSAINGILLFNSSATENIYNNMMRLGLGVANNPIIRGVYDNTATSSPTNIIHNSIYLDGTQGANTVNTACIKKDLGSTMTITDNILWNNRASTGAPGTGAGRHYGIQVLSAAGNPTSNYNDIYAPNNGGAIGLTSAGTDQATLAGWRTATSQDLNSFNSDPKFIDATNATTPNLHIDPVATTVIEANGILVGAPTDDFDGQTRSGLTPTDIGADAGNFTGIDLTAPAITYTALANTTLTTDRTLSITVTDATGVPTSGAGLPVIYYKKNAGSYVNSQCVFVSGSNYTCTLLSASLGGVVATDTVSYYVAAQDTAATPNVTTNPTVGAGGFTANPPAASTPPTTPNSYLIATAFTGTKTVCASGCDYTTLTGAAGIFNAINTSVVTGNLNIQINGNLSAETGAVALNQWAEEPSGSNFTAKIFPTGVGPWTISGSLSSNALVRLNGADRVTIDGSLNGTGTDRNLTITNTNTTAPSAVSLISLGTGLGATSNTIKNCNISTGVATSIGYGIAIGGSTPGTTGADNDNVTIQNNSITVAPVGIFVFGTAAVTSGGDDNLTVTGNSVDYNGSLASIGIQLGGSLSSSVSQNTVSEQTSATQSPTGISLETNFVSSTVTRNLVSKALTTNTGGYGGRGITIGTGTASSALTLSNNVVYGVNGSNFSGFSNSSAMGIAIGMIGNSSTISTTAGGINLYFNSVNMTGSMGSGSSSAITTAMYVGSGATALDLRNNVFVNTQVGTSATQKNYAIYSAAANTAFTTINYNDYFVANSFNAASAIPGFLTSDRTNLAGIQSGFGGNANSLVTDPMFTSGTDLRPQLGSPIVGAGQFGTGVTVDFNGTTRTNPPTMGAYDTTVDTAGPAITYTTLGNTTSTANRTLTISVTDPSGVPTSGAGLPRVYFKKSTDASYVNSQCLFTSGSSYDCLIDYSMVGGGSVTTGDIVQYYVAAQDNLNNVSVNPAAGASGLTANPPAASTPPTTPNSYSVAAAISGTLVADAGGPFTSLTNAGGIFEYINNNVVTGNITVNITSDLTAETGLNALNAFAGGFTVTIKPSGGARLVSGAAASTALIRLNGASGVTIDGSTSGGTDRSLSITNTSTTSPQVVRFGSIGTTPINNDTLKNCIIRDGVTTGLAIVASDTTGTATAGYSTNLAITNNDIGKAYVGVFVFQATAAGNGAGLVIAQNKMDNTGANAIRNTGIYVQGADGVTATGININQNAIGNFDAVTGDENDNGIWLAANTKNASVAGNTVTNLGYAGVNSFSPYGIYVATGVAAMNVNVALNTVAGITSSGTIGVYGIALGGGGGVTVQRNNVTNVNNTNTGTYGAIGISMNGDNNVVQNNFVSNITHNMTGGTAFSPAFGVFGILLSSGNNTQVYHNSVYLTGTMAGTANSSLLTAAFCINTTATGLDVRNNIFADTMNGGTTSIAHVAVYLPSGGTSAMNLTMNNNSLYYGTDSARQGAGQAGTTAGSNFFSTLTLLKAYSATLSAGGTNDNATIAATTAPPFASTTDLHIPATAPEVWTGATLATVTSDFDGDPRPASNPDLGADELVQSSGGSVPSGTFYNASFGTGDALAGNVTITSKLTLTGTPDTGANTLTMNCGASFVGGGASNYIIGNLKEMMCAPGAFTFPVGTANGYSPVDVNTTAVGGGGTDGLTVKAVQNYFGGAGETPAISPSSLLRYWDLNESGSITADIKWTFLPGDVQGGGTNYRVVRINGTNATTFVNAGDCPANPVATPCVNVAGNYFFMAGVSNFSKWTAGQQLAPTATGANIGGRILDASGHPIRNARVVLSGGNLAQPIVVQTGQLGYFNFEGIEVGRLYVVTVGAPRYTFVEPSRAIDLSGDVTNTDFVANP